MCGGSWQVKVTSCKLELVLEVQRETLRRFHNAVFSLEVDVRHTFVTKQTYREAQEGDLLSRPQGIICVYVAHPQVRLILCVSSKVIKVLTHINVLLLSFYEAVQTLHVVHDGGATF